MSFLEIRYPFLQEDQTLQIQIFQKVSYLKLKGDLS